jgi:hypothetical protein
VARTSMLPASSLLVALIVSSSVLLAQPAVNPSGHWEGTLQVPGQELKIEIDLAKSGEKWEGAISIPAQGLKGFPLTAITLQGDSVSFAMSGIPGNPQFKGTVSKDGKSLSGDFSQGGGTLPFAVVRTGDAKIEPLPKSTPITKDLEGAWEGPLDVNGTTLRLALKLSNRPEGGATGTMISVDQGGAEVPVAAVIQAGSHLKVVVQAISGIYEGDLKDGQLTGTWTQGAATFPLVFKRPTQSR